MIAAIYARKSTALAMLAMLALSAVGCTSLQDLRQIKPSTRQATGRYDVVALCVLDALDEERGGDSTGGARFVEYRVAERARISIWEPRATGYHPVFEIEVTQAGEQNVAVHVRNTRRVLAPILDAAVSRCAR